MLEALNRYAHGFVAVPVVVACRNGGMFEALRARGPMAAEALAKELGANEGHLRAALRLLESLGWISVEGGAIALAPEAENERDIPDDAVTLLTLPVEGYLSGQGPQRLLAPWIERSARRWGARTARTADLVDGALAVRVLNAIERSGCLKEGTDRLLDRVAPGAREELGSLFVGLGWASREAGRTALTEFGRFILDRALIVGTLAAYRPMLVRMPELLFGDAHKVFDRDETGQERHVDRTLNVASSGFQHDRYFADVDEMIVAIFDGAAIEAQPNYVADMGCGDGTFLKRVYETVVARTSRGKVLDAHPLTLIGIDFNDAALEATRLTLGSRPHVLLKGDIGDPEALLGAFRERGVDPDTVLHIRSFLDHDRPFVPGDRDRAQGRARIGHRGVYVNDVGRSIPAAEMMQALVEHLGRWAAVVNRHGLIVLEVHNLDPRIASAYFDSTESIHFDAYHAFSMQYLVEAAEFLAAAGEAGLFPRSGSSRRYPKTLPFARITLNWFERRPYAIRPAAPADLAALLELERASTPAPLQASEADLRARLEREPGGHVVLEKDGRIVAAAYSQRIAAVHLLESTRHADQATLRDEKGGVVQLLGLLVHSDYQDLGLGDELLEFVLHRSELMPGVERVAGISRCKDWVRGGNVSFDEYVHARTDAGEPQDPILRFHARHGARVRKIVSGYRPVDADNDGSGVLIEYDLADRRKGTHAPAAGSASLGDGRVASVVEASVREVLGPRRQEAFAPGLPLMDMGLDSMDLTELKSLLSRRLGVDLDPTLFFRHRTAAAVADHLESRTARKDPGAGAPRTRPGGRASGAAPRPLPRTRVRATRRVAEDDDRIAIIGMACRFASANSAEEYWTLLRDGAHAVRQAPPNRRGWARKPVVDADPSVVSAVRYGGFLDDVAGFDAAFFGISPREARSMDPQQRMLLETTWHAFEDAGLDASSLAASATGVFVGICTHDYEVLQLLSGSPQAFDSHFTSGNLASVAAGRIAYSYGFHGPAMSVDTACSSSLVALHLAVQSLRSGESDLALACGVNLMLAQEMSLVYARLRVLAPDGRCKTFDASADGYVRGEGCGVVVLKRLAEAQADGDRILAIVRGSAINQDGPSNGLTAPNGDAQEAVIRQALESAGVSPLEVSHIEAHGTGTVIGDPIEFQALARVFGPGRSEDQPLVIASAKTTVGHIEPAAGVAGLIKVVLSLQNELIPSHLHLSEPNPLIRLDEIPAVIPTEGMAWPRSPNGRPRLAGISSFGLSGTNAHVVLEEAPRAAAIEGRVGRGRPVQVFTLSAPTSTGLESLARAYEAFLRPRRELRLADVCFTASVGRSHLEHRLAIVFEKREELLAELAQAGDKTVRGVTGSLRPGVAFLFSGQGSQYAGMGGELFDSEPVFREALEDCDEVLREQCDVPLLSILYPRGNAADITDTALLQPALFSVEYALSRLWRSWGIEPDAVIGHSLGEYVAACVAGVMSLEDALRLVAVRGRLMGGLEEKGTMVAVAADASRAAAAIAGREHEVSIACLNGPSAVVLSGRSAAVSAAVRALEAEGVRTKALLVSNAFHSPLMDPILDAFEEEVAKIALRPPDRVLISNLLGRAVTDEVTTTGYWRRHLREPVRFAEGVNALFRAGSDSFVEIGPGTTLLGLAGLASADDAARTWVPSLRPGQPELATLLSSLGALYVRGGHVDWAGFYRGADRRKVALPGYTFERKEYWFEDGEPEAAVQLSATVEPTEAAVVPGSPTGVQAASVEPPYSEMSLAHGCCEVEWQRRDRSVPSRNGHGIRGRWLLFADDEGVADGLGRSLETGDSIRVIPGEALERVSPGEWRINPDSAEELRALLEEVSREAPLRGVAHLWSLRAAGGAEPTLSELREAQRLGSSSVLYLVQALAAANLDQKPRVWLVTEGAQPAGHRPSSMRVSQSPLVGLAKSLAAELPEIWGGMVDLAPEDPLPDRVAAVASELAGPDGELHVAYRNKERLVARLVRRAAPKAGPPPVRADATYLVAGGLGSLGSRVAGWLVEQGARNVVLAGRRRPDAGAQAAISAMHGAGARVIAVEADISEPTDVARLLDTIARSLPPLRGIVNAAGVLDDGVLLQQTADRFRNVMAAKVDGSWNLHSMTKDVPLDFFVFFSSSVSILSLVGRANYGAANAFMDALAHHRRRSGLAALSVNWGAWGGTGMTANLTTSQRRQLAEQGFGEIDPSEGLRLLGDLMAEGRAQAGVSPMDWAKYFRDVPREQVSAYFTGVQPAAAVAEPSRLLASIQAAGVSEVRDLLGRFLQERVARILGYEQAADVGRDAVLLELGFDSLMAVQLRNAIRQSLAVDVPIGKLFSSRSIDSLTQVVHERLPSVAPRSAHSRGPGERVEVI